VADRRAGHRAPIASRRPTRPTALFAGWSFSGPNGAIDTIEGDAGPEPDGQFAVIANGPFLPADSAKANGMPIYGFVQP
jgi:hypothetical protein